MSHNPNVDKGTRTLREWYGALNDDRRVILDKKREHSDFTMPSLLPWEGRVSTIPLNVPYNSTSADGINALASRTMGIVLPLNGQPIFEIGNVTPFDPEGTDDSEVQDIFWRFARFAMKQLAPTNLRAQLHVLYQHLVAIGDCMMVMDDTLNARLFRADQFVVRRKHEGDWIDIIIEESVNPDFHDELKPLMSRAKVTPNSTVARTTMEEAWETLYTHVHKNSDGSICVKQEFRDGPVGADVERPVSNYMPVRWKALIGEAYGVSLVEDIFGDIRVLDSSTKGLNDGILLGAEHRMGINPGGLTQLRYLMESINGDFVPAVPGDVFPIQYNNAAQVQGTFAAVAHMEQKLSRMFLKRQPRDAERVTAREIVADAQDLESSLGGVVSMAGVEVQDPLVRWLLHVLGERKQIPDQINKEINKQGGLVTLTIRAGLEVLQREAEREKLDGAIERMRNLPPQAHEVFIWENIARDWWQSMGLDAAGRVKTEQQVAQERAQQAQVQAVTAAAAESAAAGAQPPPTGE